MGTGQRSLSLFSSDGLAVGDEEAADSSSAEGEGTSDGEGTVVRVDDPGGAGKPVGKPVGNPDGNPEKGGNVVVLGWRL